MVVAKTRKPPKKARKTVKKKTKKVPKVTSPIHNMLKNLKPKVSVAATKGMPVMKTSSQPAGPAAVARTRAAVRR